VHVHEHVVGAADLPQSVLHRDEGRRGGLEEDVARQVDHAEGLALALDDRRAPPGLGREVVRGAHDVAAGVEVGPELAVAVRVVAQGDRVDAGGEELVGLPRGQPDAARGVLPVRHDEVEPKLLTEGGEQGAHHAPPGAAHDVAHEEDEGHGGRR